MDHIFFYADDVEARLEYVCDKYTDLKRLDPNNTLLKYAVATYTELYWNKAHSKEFHERFSEPQHTSDFRANLDLNYGMALSDEVLKLTTRKSSTVPKIIMDELTGLLGKN